MNGLEGPPVSINSAVSTAMSKRISPPRTRSEGSRPTAEHDLQPQVADAPARSREQLQPVAGNATPSQLPAMTRVDGGTGRDGPPESREPSRSDDRAGLRPHRRHSGPERQGRNLSQFAAPDMASPSRRLRAMRRLGHRRHCRSCASPRRRSRPVATRARPSAWPGDRARRRGPRRREIRGGGVRCARPRRDWPTCSWLSAATRPALLRAGPRERRRG